MRTTVLWPILLLLATALPAAADPVCARAVAGPGVAGAPQAWQSAVERLVESTAAPGHPWSCGGGTVDLSMEASGTSLVVSRRGEAAVERPVTDAEEVVPLGQAILSLPLIPAAVEPPPPVTPTTPLAKIPLEPMDVRDRLVVGGQVASLLAGGSDALLLGGQVHAGVPLGAWLPAVTLRVDGAIAGHRTGFADVSMGAQVSRSFAWTGWSLRTGLSVGAAVLQRDLPRPAGSETRVDARAGVSVAYVRELTPALNLVAGLQGEWALGRKPDHPVADATGESLTPFPFFLAGAAVGVEVRL